MFMIQLSTQRNIQFSFHDMMYKIHSLDDQSIVKWAKIALYQLQEKEIQECSNSLALNQDQVTQ